MTQITGSTDLMDQIQQALLDIDGPFDLEAVMSAIKSTIASESSQKEGSNLWKSLILVEVLGDQPIHGLTLEAIAREGNSGEFSVEWEVLASSEISPVAMVQALENQGSEPSFLVEDDWIYQLKPGDRITWNDPDDDACSRTDEIKSIDFRSDSVHIVWSDDGEVEGPISEFSPA